MLTLGRYLGIQYTCCLSQLPAHIPGINTDLDLLLLMVLAGVFGGWPEWRLHNALVRHY
jgi:hypothetical protein